MAKLRDLTYKSASELFRNRRSQAAAENTLYFKGDHLQKDSDYRGYIGERPPSGENYGEFMNRVEANFVSRNAVKEFIERHINGITGREPLWRFFNVNTQKDDLTDRQREAIKEAEDAMTSMWNDKEFLNTIQKIVTTALLEEKCVVRPYILTKWLDESGRIVKQKSLPDALKLLRFEVLTADKAGVFEDEETFDDIGIYAFEDATTKQKRAEVTFVGPDGKTYLKVIDGRDLSDIAAQLPTLGKYIDDADRFSPQTYALGDLGGRLFLYEFKREALISEQVRSLQKCLNLDLTMMMRNINLAGFRQKSVTNAQKPTAKTTVTTDGITETVKAEVPLKAGLTSVPFLNGLPIYSKDAQGNQFIAGYTNPNINITDPVSPDTFIKSMTAFYEAMLTEVNQLHVAISGDATASGKSRQEARAEFEKSLMRTKTTLDAFGRWLLELALRFAANLCQTPEYLELRADFNSIVDAGTPDASEVDSLIKLFDKGVLSAETLMSETGRDDTDAEMAKIKSEDGYEARRLKPILEAIERAGDVLLLREKRKLLFPEKTDAEIDADVLLIQQEIERGQRSVGDMLGRTFDAGAGLSEV